MKKTYKFVSCLLSLTLCFAFLFVVPIYAQEDLLSQKAQDLSECGEIELESNVIGVVLTTASSDEILSRLISQEAFSLEGSLVKGNKVMPLNESYDFSTMSRFAIADWAYQNDLISEAQKIEGYCDLLENQIFENVVCLDSFYSEIENYANTNLISASLDEKISSVLDVQSLNSQNTRNTVHFIEINGIVIDDELNTLSDATLYAIGEYASSLKTMFENMGFNFPNHPQGGTDYIISLSTSTSSTVCQTQLYHELSSTTCLVSTHIYGVNNSTTLSNTLRQRIAHGMFHAIQNFYYGPTINWFKEACADWGAWATTGLTTGINFNSFINSRRSMAENVGHGAMLFPATISQYYGGAATIEEIYYQLYVNIHGQDESEEAFLKTAIDGALEERGYRNVTFEDVFFQMSAFLAEPAIYGFITPGLYNSFNGGEIVYYEGDDFQEDDIRGLDRAYFSFTPDEALLDYEIEFEIGVFGDDVDIHHYWYNDNGELIIEHLNLSSDGTVTFSHPNYDEGNPSGFVGIVIACANMNANTRVSFYINYTVTEY